MKISNSISMKIRLSLIVSILFTGMCLNAQKVNPTFKNVSKEVGLSQIKANKYWTPTIADLNRDGYYDLMLLNHGGNKVLNGERFFSPEMYWGSAKGYIPFKRSKEMMDGIPVGGTDYHGFAAGYFGNKDDYPDLIMTVGGANGGRGNLPITVEFIGGTEDYIVRRDINRKDPLVDPSLQELGIDGFGRGRSAFFIDMDQDGDLDLVYNCNGPNPEKSQPENITDSKFIYEWKDGKFNRIKNIGAIKDCEKEMSAIADINHDGRVDLIYYAKSEPMECWISQGDGFDYKLDNSFLPGDIEMVAAVAEIDYDGDGDFDLYLARGAYKGEADDMLLEWDEKANKYIDVTKKAKLPKGGMHDGVSVGDFDNNGYQDVFIGVSGNEAEDRHMDLILMNNGDKTFETVTTHGACVLEKGELGDQGEVFDYNGDGKLDILSGSKYGLWRMFENTTENSNGNFVSVRVGRSNSKEKFAPLGAKVTVVAQKGNKTFKVVRRINSQGQSHAQSFLDTMHFGLGEFDTISEIIVDYGTHSETTKFKGKDAKAGQTLTVGQFFTAAK